MASSRPPSRGQSPTATGMASLLLLVALVVIAMIRALIRTLERREYQARHAANAGLRITTTADARGPQSLDKFSFPSSAPPYRKAGRRSSISTTTRTLTCPASAAVTPAVQVVESSCSDVQV